MTYIKVNSVTHAMKGRDVLVSNGIKASIKRLENRSGTESCGYAIYVNSNADDAVRILKENKVKVLGYGNAREKQ